MLECQGSDASVAASELRKLRSIANQHHPYLMPLMPGPFGDDGPHYIAKDMVNGYCDGSRVHEHTVGEYYDMMYEACIECLDTNGEERCWTMERPQTFEEVVVMVEVGRGATSPAFDGTLPFLTYRTTILGAAEPPHDPRRPLAASPCVYLPVPEGIHAEDFGRLAIFQAGHHGTGKLAAYFPNIMEYDQAEMYGNTASYCCGSQDSDDLRFWQVWVRGVKAKPLPHEEREEAEGSNGMGISFSYAMRVKEGDRSLPGPYANNPGYVPATTGYEETMRGIASSTARGSNSDQAAMAKRFLANLKTIDWRAHIACRR